MAIVQLHLFDGKYCPGCGELKPLSGYRKDLLKPDKLARLCKVCQYTAEKRYHAAQKTERAEITKRWHQDHRDQSNAAKRKWGKQNKDRVNTFTRVRRGRIRANGGSFTVQQWEVLCAKYDHRCLRCGEQKPLTIDHIVPVSKEGSGDISNIQPLCYSCNTAKKDRTIDYRPDEDIVMGARLINEWWVKEQPSHVPQDPETQRAKRREWRRRYVATHRDRINATKRAYRQHKRLQNPAKDKQGEHNNRAKLTGVKVLAIRQLHTLGFTNRALAMEFSVTPSTISMIVLGKRWQHLSAALIGAQLDAALALVSRVLGK